MYELESALDQCREALYTLADALPYTERRHDGIIVGVADFGQAMTIAGEYAAGFQDGHRLEGEDGACAVSPYSWRMRGYDGFVPSAVADVLQEDSDAGETIVSNSSELNMLLRMAECLRIPVHWSERLG